MIYLKKFNESKSNYIAVVVWEDTKVRYHDHRKYEFNDEDDLLEFLYYLYDLRGFMKMDNDYSGGYFEDGHYQRISEYVDKINQKYNNKFNSYLVKGKRYNYPRAAISNVFVIIGGQSLPIVWMQALKAKIIDIPKIGDRVKLNTGNIHNKEIAAREFGGSVGNYYEYDDYEWLDEGDEDNKIYGKFTAEVLDCKVVPFEPDTHNDYKYDPKTDTEELIYSEENYQEIISLTYYILSRHVKFVMTSVHGYDPKFGDKFNRPEFGTNDYFLVP